MDFFVVILIKAQGPEHVVDLARWPTTSPFLTPALAAAAGPDVAAEAAVSRGYGMALIMIMR